MPAFNNGRIQRGYLHKFNVNREIALAFFMGLSYCQPRCERMFTMHKSGCNVILRATRNIAAGEPIFEHIDSASYSMCPRIRRQVQNVCECDLCKNDNRRIFDKLNAYEYKCENVKCGKYFSAGEECVTASLDVKCLSCGHIQGWQSWSSVLVHLNRNERNRACLFKYFDHISNHVRGCNDMHMGIGFHIVLHCLQTHVGGHALTEKEFLKLFEICKNCIEELEILYDPSYKDYLQFMLLIWDVIALANIVTPKSIILSTLNALKVISIKEKTNILYYYEDYVKMHVK